MSTLTLSTFVSFWSTPPRPLLRTSLMHGPLMNMLPGKDREEVAHLLSRLQQTTPTTNKQTLQQTNKQKKKIQAQYDKEI